MKSAFSCECSRFEISDFECDAHLPDCPITKIKELEAKLLATEKERDAFQTQAGALKKQLFLSQVAEGKMGEAINKLDCLNPVLTGGETISHDMATDAQDMALEGERLPAYWERCGECEVCVAQQSIPTPSSNVQVYEVLKEAKEALEPFATGGRQDRHFLSCDWNLRLPDKSDCSCGMYKILIKARLAFKSIGEVV